MYFLQQLHEHEIKGTFFIFSLKIGSETEFLISSATFFQSLLALYAMLSKRNFFFSGILRFKYMEISQIVRVFSEVQDITHIIRRKAIQLFINPNHKEFYAFLVDRFFISILKKYFEIRDVVLLNNKAQASFINAINSTDRMFCAKHPY